MFNYSPHFRVLVVCFFNGRLCNDTDAYPITRLFVSYEVSRWHTEARNSFSAQSPANWQTILYVPAEKIDMSSLRQIVEPSRRDALGIPIYTPEDRQALFRIYAPVWEIQFQGDYDRIGAPIYTDSGVLSVNTNRLITYTLLSFTRFGNEIFIQLNYIIWFPSRPKEGAFDRLDSYQFSFAQNAQNIFQLPWNTSVHKEIILNQLFETRMVPACPGWVFVIAIFVIRICFEFRASFFGFK